MKGKATGRKGRMAEYCVFLDTGMAALRFELVLGRLLEVILRILRLKRLLTVHHVTKQMKEKYLGQM